MINHFPNRSSHHWHFILEDPFSMTHLLLQLKQRLQLHYESRYFDPFDILFFESLQDRVVTTGTVVEASRFLFCNTSNFKPISTVKVEMPPPPGQMSITLLFLGSFPDYSKPTLSDFGFVIFSWSPLTCLQNLLHTYNTCKPLLIDYVVLVLFLSA